MSEMYAGAVLFNDLYASTHILNSIRAAIGSHCKSISHMFAWTQIAAYTAKLSGDRHRRSTGIQWTNYI